jgi:predicted O-methyltransferase YrrM
VEKLESTFTQSHADCVSPGWWHSADAESTEYEVTELVAAFVRALQPSVVLETGTAFGQTAERIGLALQSNGHGQLWTLEPDKERAASARERCLGLPVRVITTSSLDWTPQGFIDFAWLDSLPDLRIQELRRFHDSFSPRAIVGIHDTAPQHDPLRSEIEQAAVEGLLRPIFLPTPRGVAFCEVLQK